MLIEQTEKVIALFEEMKTSGITENLKVLCYPSDDYPGFSYMKIYNKNASVENMIDYLMEESHLKKVMTVSDDQSRRDVTYSHYDGNEIVRRLNKFYYWGDK